MRPFTYYRADGLKEAVTLARSDGPSHVAAPVQYLAGGTTLLDLMKLEVMRPDILVDISHLDTDALHGVTQSADGLRIGAMMPMARLAREPLIVSDYPLLSESLWQAASAQLRNMARLSGNVLQRTRCPYFRDTSYDECNKRQPGSGCAARDGYNRMHAILGTSEHCIATYPGDWAQALIALDAEVELLGTQGIRTIPFADLHRLPGDSPHIETTLEPGELIIAFLVPGGPWKRSLYRKIRDRESYAFANASAAVALDLASETVSDVRIGLGGVATIPWRARKAEEVLRGAPLTEERAQAAAEAEFADAHPHKHNAFKVPLGKATLVRALMEAKAMEV